MRPVPLGGAAGEDDHQDDVLARVREAWARSTALPFATAASLRDIDAAEFSTHILPALEQLDGVRVETSGDRPAYRELSGDPARSEEHTSELPSLMRISYAGFCLQQK